MGAISIAGVLLIIVLAVTSFQAYQATNEQVAAKEVVTKWLGPDATFQVQKVVLLGSGVDVTLNGEGTFPPIENLAAMMEQKFNHPVIIRLHISPEKRVTYPAALVGLAKSN